MLFSQAFEDRHFTKHESVPQNVAGIIKAQRLIEIAGKQIHFTEREISFETLNEVRRIRFGASRLEDSTRQWTGYFSSADAAFNE